MAFSIPRLRSEFHRVSSGQHYSPASPLNCFDQSLCSHPLLQPPAAVMVSSCCRLLCPIPLEKSCSHWVSPGGDEEKVTVLLGGNPRELSTKSNGNTFLRGQELWEAPKFLCLPQRLLATDFHVPRWGSCWFSKLFLTEEEDQNFGKLKCHKTH